MRFEESHGSFSSSVEKVPQTLVIDLISFTQREDNEVVVPLEEDLVEARVSWDIGKALGLKVGNDKAMVVALAKVQECQDFVLQRRRDHPRKNKGQTKV